MLFLRFLFWLGVAVLVVRRVDPDLIKARRALKSLGSWLWGKCLLFLMISIGAFLVATVGLILWKLIKWAWS